MIEEFPYYGLSWFLYLVVTAAFLLFCLYKTRNWPHWIRLSLLSFMAAMALTPGTTISGESWLSPAAIIMILELDKKGLSGIWPHLTSITAVWLLIMLLTSLVRWQFNKRIKRASSSQPELIDPE